MAIFRRGPSNWGKNHDFQLTSGFGIDHCWSVVNSFDHVVKFITADADDSHHASVDLVYDSKGSTSFLSVDGRQKRTTRNLIVCTGKSEAKVI